ncbi:NAD(P)-dependent alcohol dehydrogenase [Falsirhodobacter halotolerans]|uniref:NAD(P)-dependent alcohol dehydrogenase n=1 Tax=Falsirhodobacter halotolerans TaxID=1146892 RepID=UPI001FD294E9|nr:NAD(P)-dependent alcohol dehydrogenase [Falsirhodobacter halotolerans]MCJ8139160.1 NAD(P)-dependent alcohol dehydrogenase [Falsirhodobacter halotolerans]
MTILAIGTAASDQPLDRMEITRRDTGPHDVRIDIAFCGICHSDIHTARGEWPGTMYPCVPGHEIVGRVAEVGAHVTSHKVGDLVGVGCIVDSCQHCEECADGAENYCDNMVGTYNAPTDDRPGHTLGSYAKGVVVHERYVLKITHPEEQLAAVAPLLCAGITTYSPLRHWKVGPGMKVGVVGIGGLGHMGLKLAHAMGAHVVAFTTSDSKREAAKALGADEVVLSRNADELAAHAKSFDFILNTVAAPHDLDAFLTLLKRDGTMTLVGAPASPHPSPNVFNFIMKRRSLAGSMIGGIPETQEMLDFCTNHGIVSDIEMIRADEIEPAYDRMVKGDVKYRFVMDIATLG